MDPGDRREKLQQVVTDRHLHEIACKVKYWEELAPYLNLTEAEQVEIKQDYSSSYKQQKARCLRRWKEKYGPQATYQQLIDAAKDSGKAELACFITELLGKAIAV